MVVSVGPCGRPSISLSSPVSSLSVFEDTTSSNCSLNLSATLSWNGVSFFPSFCLSAMPDRIPSSRGPSSLSCSNASLSFLVGVVTAGGRASGSVVSIALVSGSVASSATCSTWMVPSSPTDSLSPTVSPIPACWPTSTCAASLTERAFSNLF